MKLVDLSTAKVGNELIPSFNKTLIQQGIIIEQAIIDDLPNEVYHNEMKGVSASTLKHCTTPIAYKSQLDKPKKYKKENMITGTALHTIVLEPDKFCYRYFDEEKILDQIQKLRPEKERENLKRLKEYKEVMSQWKDEQGEFYDDVMPLSTYKSILSIRKRIMSYKELQNLFINSVSEQSIMLTYNNGLKVKIRPDLLKVADHKDAVNLKDYGIKEGDLINISVKTTIDGSPNGFRREAFKLKYHLAEAFYQDVLKSVYPNKIIHTIYLMCEKDVDNTFTGNVILYHNSENHISIGREDYKNNLEVYEYCTRTGDYSQGYEFFNGGSILMEI